MAATASTAFEHVNKENIGVRAVCQSYFDLAVVSFVSPVFVPFFRGTLPLLAWVYRDTNEKQKRERCIQGELERIPGGCIVLFTCAVAVVR